MSKYGNIEPACLFRLIWSQADQVAIKISEGYSKLGLRKQIFLALFLTSPSVLSAQAQSDAWQQYPDAGAKAFQQANYGQAERNFLSSLKEAQRIGKGDLRLATSCTNLGVFYSTRGDAQKAENYFEQAVKVKETLLGPDDKDCLQSEGKLCRFYLEKGNEVKADRCLNYVLSYADKELEAKRSLTRGLKEVANYFDAHPSQKAAGELVHQAEELSQKRVVEQFTDLATLLDGLGNIYAQGAKKSPQAQDKPFSVINQSSDGLSEKRFKQSEQLLSRALEFREQVLPGNHIALASSCDHLANLYMAHGKYKEAETYYRRSYTVSSKVLGEDSGETLARKDRLARSLFGAGKRSQAEELEQQIIEASFKNGGLTLANAMLAYGSMLSQDGRTKESESQFSKAIHIYEGVNGPEHASLAPLLEAYADALDRGNRHGEAGKLRARAKAIRG